MYSVQTWDEDEHCVNYYSVPDAIDYDDAIYVIQNLYPDKKIIAVTKHAANENQ